MRLPNTPQADARDEQVLKDSLSVLPLVFAKLALMAPQSVRRRKTARAAYREYHLLSVNVPRPFKPPRDHPLAGFYAQAYRDQIVPARVTLFGVKLVPGLKLRGTVLDQVKQVAGAALDQLGQDTRPDSEFDADADTIRQLLVSCGMRTPTREDIRTCEAWWSAGTSSDTPMLPHMDHMHGFDRISDALAAEQLTRVDRDGRDCTSWDDEFPGEWGWQMACLASTSFNDESVHRLSDAARWAAFLLRQGSAVVSMRGLIEPTTITRKEIKRNMARYESDLNTVGKAGKEAQTESVDAFVFHRDVEQMYARKRERPSPTSVETSVIAAIPGTSPDLCEKLLADQSVIFTPMINLQLQAMAEAQLCSPVRSNAVLLDLPTDVVAFAGCNDVSTAGDAPSARTALSGFTERDRQPVWEAPDASSTQDKPPIKLLFGDTGSGKTMLQQWLWWQWGHVENKHGELTPSVMVNPKAQSLARTAEWGGARRLVVDSQRDGDGGLDPLGFFEDKESAITTAAGMLQDLYSGSPEQVAAAQLPLLEAVRFGVDHGATATGQAIHMYIDELQHQLAVETMPVRRSEIEHDIGVCDHMLRVTNQPQARAIIGSGAAASGAGLRVQQGMVLIEATGGISLPLNTDPALMNLSDKINLYVIRMILLAAMHALSGRQGVIFLDEGWVFLMGGKALMEMLGRLARSLGVTIVLGDQRVQQSSQLSDFVSGGYVLALKGKPVEGEPNSVLAFKTFELDPDWHGRAHRASLSLTIDGTPEDQASETTFNWESLRALVDPVTRRVARGSVAYFKDLYGRCPTVEILLPSEFVKVASTTPDN
jgi:hypothetical protein